MLCVKTIGTGQDLVLLHGWAFSSALFADLVAQYQHQYRITLIDLPGHGKSEMIEGEIQQWCDGIIEVLPNRPILLGWSLGGLLAIQIASRIPIRQLILVGVTPNFIQNKNWHYGIPKQNFDQFAQTLKRDTAKGLKRFSALQSQDKTEFKMLSRSIDNFPPSAKALNQGLKILLNTDLTSELKQLQIPIQAILGAYDGLVPIAIQDWYAQQNIPTTTLDAGHLPFLHPEFAPDFV